VSRSSLPALACGALLAVMLICALPVAAQDATPDPAAGATTELLVDVTFPAEFVPAGPAIVGNVVLTLESGARVDCPSAAPADGVDLAFVLEGTLAVRSDGAIIAVRAGGERDAVVPGSEVTLGPGDTALTLDREVVRSIGNSGAGPAVVSTAFIVSSEAPATPLPIVPPVSTVCGYPSTFGPPDWERTGLAGGPVRAHLERLILPPGTSPPPVEAPWPVLGYVVAGRGELAITRADGTPAPGRPLRFRVGSAVAYIGWLSPVPGTTFTLSNPGDEPLVLLVLTLEPAQEAGTPTADATAS
jgi:hypothetical protein